MNQPPVDNQEYRNALKMIDKQTKNMSDMHKTKEFSPWGNVPLPGRTDTERLNWLEKHDHRSSICFWEQYQSNQMGLQTQSLRNFIDHKMIPIQEPPPCPPPPPPQRRHKIVSAPTLETLSVFLNSAMNDGWELHGSLVALLPGYAQAVIWTVPEKGEK